MGLPIIVLAGQSNAARVAGEFRDALDAMYGAGNYVLVKVFSSGAPLTSTRDPKDDWQQEGELRTLLVDATADALRANPGAHVAGLAWVQGEGDTDNPEAPALYRDAFLDLLDYWQDGLARALPGRDTGVADAHIALSALSMNAPSAPGRGWWTDIREELFGLGEAHGTMTTIDPDLVAQQAGIAVADMFTDGLHYGDGISQALADSLVKAIATGPNGAPISGTTLRGTGGNDVFMVDSTQDIVIEAENAGHDHVIASVSFSLRDHGMTIEDLTLTGQAHLTGTGNGLDNVIRGNDGNNLLNGAWGNDALYGGAGNDTLMGSDGDDTLAGGTGDDTYYIDSAGDVIAEARDEGIDTVYSTVSMKLWRDADNVETLILQGSDDLFADGNHLDNLITGNDGDNLINGARGNDVLFGEGGNDTLIGQSGSDYLGGGAGNDRLFGDMPDALVDPGICGQVFRLYQATLDRAPDYGGFEYWTETLSAGEAYLKIATGFVQSREFQQVYGAVSNADFVELLYNNVLDRGSDGAGKAGWLRHLENGATREFVVSHFAESLEFQTMTNPEVVAWMRALGTDDVLVGTHGNDTLTGGAMSDTFLFKTRPGNHTVTDLEAWDTIDLTAFGYGSETEALNAFRQAGSDMVFEDQGVTVTFEDVTLSDITDDMLIL